MTASLCTTMLFAALNRRAAIRIGASAIGGAGTALRPQPLLAKPTLDGYNPTLASTAPAAGRSYFPPLTPPLFDRATYRYDLGRDAWALEQLLTFANVSATVRTVVVKLADGTLWVDGPQWPTGEYCRLLDELGPVGHVVLPCVALEHKAPMKAFCQRYPSASCWIAPGQYGPFGSCDFTASSAKGMGYRVDGVLPMRASDPMPPWSDEFDMRTLYVNLPENAGPVAEAAFYHRRTKTLVTTDSVVYVPSEPPPIFSTFFDARVIEQPDFWPKSVLQAVFLPLRQNPDASSADTRWPGYDAVRGRLIRAPILRAFADARAPDAVREWIASVAAMGRFDRILTAHFASPVAATPEDYLAAFAYLDGPTAEPPIACADWALLNDLNTFIAQNKLGAPVVTSVTDGCL